jgi:hypothetical protein
LWRITSLYVVVPNILLSEKLFLMVLAVFAFGFFAAITVGTFVAIIVSQTAENCRVSIIGIALGLTTIIGAFTPAINEILIAYFNTNIAPAFYIMLCTIISLCSLSVMKDKQAIREVSDAKYCQATYS